MAPASSSCQPRPIGLSLDLGRRHTKALARRWVQGSNLAWVYPKAKPMTVSYQCNHCGKLSGCVCSLPFLRIELNNPKGNTLRSPCFATYPAKPHHCSLLLWHCSSQMSQLPPWLPTLNSLPTPPRLTEFSPQTLHA